ncbi:hypothetical protein [Paenibacillus mucilaginosus]|uniref:hypothetical protein n=1 Tax=Paenibacillus mucilaginosus TaxID=61624 RepID=UPI0002D83699|nr:hypothetical protein [Paenibacillus mucilaginosus]
MIIKNFRFSLIHTIILSIMLSTGGPGISLDRAYADDFPSTNAAHTVTTAASSVYADTMEPVFTPADATIKGSTPVTSTVYANTLENPGFETGDMTGWTVIDGGAFGPDSVSDETMYWAEGIPYGAGRHLPSEWMEA